MTKWIGKLVELRDKRWRKPQLVRIIDAEVAPALWPRQGNSVWFWAKYA